MKETSDNRKVRKSMSNNIEKLWLFDVSQEKVKIAIMALLVSGDIGLIFYFHAFLKTSIIFTHFFYIPIVVAAIWWMRKGLIVPILLGGILIVSGAVFLGADYSNNIVRAFMFCMVCLVVSMLREWIAEGEKEVRKSEEKYRGIFNNSVEGMFQSTTEGKFITANPALAEIFCYDSPEALIGTITDIGHQIYADSEDHLELIKRLEKRGIVKGFETQFSRRDGGKIWGSVNLRTAYDEQGVLSHYDGFFEDITIRKQAEAKLREEEALKTSILGAIPHAVIGVRERRIIFANEGVETVFGWKPEELIGKDTKILYRTDEEYEEIGSRFYLGLEAHRTHGDEDVCMQCKDGQDILCRLTTARIGDALKEKKIVATFEDITERRRVEEKLKEYSDNLEEMIEDRTKELKAIQKQLVRREKLAVLGQLSGGVSHELRNPLGVISNAVYYLKMVLTEGDETVKEYLEIISSEVETAGKIVSDLLDFSRARAAEREEVALCDLVSQVLSRRPPPKTVEVIIKIPVELSPIYVDSRQMRQVLVNLFSNSCQAMPEGGMLTIRAAEGSSNVKFSITDTGCGISEENKQKIFEPLFTTKSRGIGLGLAVTKNLIEINGGSIEVESEEGKGTTVKVILPHKGFEA